MKTVVAHPKVRLFPRVMAAGKPLSIVAAAIVMIHGAVFVMENKGMEKPREPCRIRVCASGDGDTRGGGGNGMWVLDKKIDKPMDAEAGRLKNMYREKKFSALLLLRLAYQSLGIAFREDIINKKMTL
ncbi:hypothetical protein RJT34_09183 [Clitoria ternatea]|uniref:Uncharacterized protein n=1 Tax=Clitoria ternatea TaxID=43366 RepID=A0AAN9K4N4_CLITE